MKQHGYFFLDHRDSPGFTETEAAMFGRAPGSVLFEGDTLWCPHCSTHVFKHKDRTRDRANCYKCNHYICDGCAWEMRQPGYVHAPFMKLVDDAKSKG